MTTPLVGYSVRANNGCLPSPQSLLECHMDPRQPRLPLPTLSSGGRISHWSSLPFSEFSTSTGNSRGHKRSPSSTPLRGEPAKKATKWGDEETQLNVELRRTGMKWEDIAKQLPGRSATSCRLRYQNYSEKKQEWNEERKNTLARLYIRFRKDIWDTIGKEMGLPSRAVEDQVWALGAEEIAKRANHPPFLLDRAHYQHNRSPYHSDAFASHIDSQMNFFAPYRHDSEGPQHHRRRSSSTLPADCRYSVQSGSSPLLAFKLPPIQCDSINGHGRSRTSLITGDLDSSIADGRASKEATEWYGRRMTPPSSEAHMTSPEH